MAGHDLNRRAMLGAGAGLAGAAAVPGQAAAAPPRGSGPLDPRSYQKQVHGPLTRVLVLGSPHLSGAPETFDPAVLEPLLQRLEAFAPEFITIEALSGESVNALWQYRDVYPNVFKTYGAGIDLTAAAGRANTGLDMNEAEAEARRLLGDWPAQPTPAQRRRLCAVFASAGDIYSALLQWWRLESAERRTEDGVGRTLHDRLNAMGGTRNENHLIGVRLAARLGHERIFPADDHSADDVMTPLGEDLGPFLDQPWFKAVVEHPDFQPLINASQTLTTATQALDTYRLVNRPESGRLDADMQWLSFINRESPNRVGRRRVGEWEARNLRMAAHIREVTSLRPGARVLCIVGSAHKAWLDVYLGMMMDHEIVDARSVLG